MSEEKTVQKEGIRPIVMSVTVALFIVLLAAIVINAEAFYDFLYNAVMNNAMWGLGWFSSLVCLGMVVFCVVVMVTPLGNVKLGGPNAKPKFTMMQWFGISLCTGIGAGVVFWGAAEPLIFAMDIPAYTGLQSGSDGAVLWSMVRCFLEWGLTPYATCVVTGVVLAYLILNKNAPFKTSSLLIPLFGDKVVTSKWADAFDAWSAFALTAAVAGGLGYGAMQLSSAVKAFAGIQPSTTIYIVIIIFMFICYNLSAVSGLRAGITWLSNKNVQLFFILLIFVFLAGPTAYICNLFTESLGGYLDTFFSASLNTAPYPDAGRWPQNWDMYWWVDWMAYAPLLGLFMVRCAYGRTLKEFVLIEWLLPALFGIVWFSVFGGTILYAQLWEGHDFLSIYQNEGAEALTLAMFDVLPIGTIAKIVMLVIITISLVTQCDSMAVTLAGMSFKGADENTEPPARLKLFWGTVFAVVAAVFVSLGGIDGVKTIKSFAGIPMCFICLACMIGFVKFILKRPRNVDGSFKAEPEVADQPDNGEPMAPRSKIKWINKLGW
ncbi:MAG: BCCT family transporter [Lachnospiraceae bacterium]|nr:BCCT family transporter [Lachnospiraceae bacterium]